MGFLLALLAGVQAAPAFAAATPAQVRTALTSDPVFIDPDAEAAGLVDAGRVRSAIGSSAVVVAVLPEADAKEAGVDCSSLPRRIGGQRTVFVLCGYQPVGGSAVVQSGAVQSILRGLGSPERTREAFTSAIVSFVAQAKVAPRATGSSGGTSNGPASDGDDSGSVVGWVVGGVAVAGIGGGAYYVSRRRKRRVQDDLAARKADIESLYSRLGSDISTLDPGEDAAARQAMVDASERYNSAGGLRARATTAGELAAVRDILVEGLHATRAVRRRKGLELGPPIPEPPAPEGAQEPVTVGGQTYQASPTYAPGAANYFPGGTVGGTFVPGGWYGSRFWEGALLGGLAGTLLTGGFGGFGYGGYGGYGIGYDQGYDSGYDRGYEQGSDAGSGAGGDGGSGADWGPGDSGGGWGADSGGWGGGDSGGWGGGDSGGWGGGDSGGGGGDSGGGSW